MDILTDVLDRVRLKGTLLFHYELSRPWSLALPQFPDAVFHYLSRGSASSHSRMDERSLWRTAISSSSPVASLTSSGRSQDEAVPAARSRSATGAPRGRPRW